MRRQEIEWAAGALAGRMRNVVSAALSAAVLAALSAALLAAGLFIAHPAAAVQPATAKAVAAKAALAASAVAPMREATANDAVPRNDALLDALQFDKQCRRAEEKNDVWEKLQAYGGKHAQLRMERLLDGGFQYADLKPEDTSMLRYLALTTAWVPDGVQNAIGANHLKAARGDGDADRDKEDETDNDATPSIQETQRRRLQEDIAAFKPVMAGYAGNAEVVVENGGLVGASATVGGLIRISPGFMNELDANEPLRRLVVAHELAHLYKRHALKALQYELIGSAAGFELAKKLLGRMNPKVSFSALELARGALIYLTATNQLYDFVRSAQIRFPKELETEADACVAEWAQRRGQNAEQMWVAFAGLAKTPTPDGKAYAQTHPSHDERKLNVARITAKGKPGAATAKTTARYTKPRLRAEP